MAIRYEEFSVENIADVVVLGMELHDESPQKHIPFDIERAAQNAYESIILNQHGFGLLAFDGDVPIGMIAGVLATYDFGGQIYAFNNVWYVKKERRGSPVGIKLLDRFVDWSKDQGAMQVLLGVASGITPERTGKAVLRKGFVETGRNYIKDL